MPHGTLHTILRHIHRRAGGPDAHPLTDAQLLERYVAQHDAEAFAALVRRHGRLVLAACRRCLTAEADVEDAFQATFLVLLRKAGSIRRRQALGCWLYHVAGRCANEARLTAERRRRRERQSALLIPTPPAPDPSWREVCELLYVELDRLPEKLRLPLILCYLDGKTRDEAAAQLGWSLGALRGQLERGRSLLRARLSRRGVELTAGVLALMAGDALAGPLPHLVRSTAGLAAGGPCPAAVAALAGAVATASTAKKVAVAGLVLAAGLLVAGAGAALTPAGNPPADKMPAPVKPAPQTAANANALMVTGRVFGPDGQPAAGAKLFVCDGTSKHAAPQPAADADGRFRFTFEMPPVPEPRFLLASAAGTGLDWALIWGPESGRDLTLRLPADLPVHGKVVDLEGKPVAGAAVRIDELTTSESGNLDEFLKQWAADKEKSPTGPTFRLLMEKQLWSQEALKQFATATTGPDGTFLLTGIGRDRGLLLGVRGAGIADQYVRVVTRPDFQASQASQGLFALSGPEPVMVVAPSKPILGTVRDAQTKQPLAGIRVLGYTPDSRVETVTDAQGRYRLDGLAKAARQIVCFDPGAGAPHMHRFEQVSDTEGLTPITLDTELHRGAVVSGRVTDRATGRPVRARVVYAPLRNNENYSSTPGYKKPPATLWIDSREMITGADGRYRLTALPGPGALFVQAVAGARQYTLPAVPKEEQDPGIYDARGETFWALGLGDIFPMSDLNAYRLIRPAADAAALTADFALDPGVRRRGRLLDPDGRPLSGTEAINLAPLSAWVKVLPGAEFTAEALNPARPRRLLFWHRDRKLAGTVVLRGDEPEPVTVTLQPLAALTGRAVLKTGEPLVGHAVEYGVPWREVEWPGQDKRFKRQPILTDQEGRFRVTDLPAGVPLDVYIIAPKTRYEVIYREAIILEPGQTKDLGDLRGRPMNDVP
jgi:RNA polymerase sigma factor (sigma-70 family)